MDRFKAACRLRATLPPRSTTCATTSTYSHLFPTIHDHVCCQRIGRRQWWSSRGSKTGDGDNGSPDSSNHDERDSGTGSYRFHQRQIKRYVHAISRSPASPGHGHFLWSCTSLLALGDSRASEHYPCCWCVVVPCDDHLPPANLLCRFPSETRNILQQRQARTELYSALWDPRL